MIRPLRKRHMLVWWVWALLLPVVFVAGVSLSPAWSNGKENPIQQGSIQDILASNEFAYGRVLVTTAGSTNNTLHMHIDKPVPAAFATVHAAFEEQADVKGSILLGKVGGIGNKEYPLPNRKVPTHLIVFDQVKQETLYTINLSN